MKPIFGLTIRSRNHEACCQANMLTFKHIQFRKMLNFDYQINDTESPCLLPLKKFFCNKSNFMKKLNIFVEEKYDIKDVMNNDREAVSARISFIFLREPRYAGYTLASYVLCNSNPITAAIQQPMVH